MFKDKSGNTQLMKSLKKEAQYTNSSNGWDKPLSMNFGGLPDNNMLNMPQWKSAKGSKMRNMLRSYSEDINQVNAEGDSALHVAISSQKWVNAMLLLRYHSNTVNVNLQNKYGETPLYTLFATMPYNGGLTIAQQIVPLARELLRLGARTDSVAGNGFSPIGLLLRKLLQADENKQLSNMVNPFMGILTTMDGTGKLVLDETTKQVVANLNTQQLYNNSAGDRIRKLLSKYLASATANMPSNTSMPANMPANVPAANSAMNPIPANMSGGRTRRRKPLQRKKRRTLLRKGSRKGNRK